MNTADSTAKGPGSFYCQRFKIWLQREKCIIRRHRAIEIKMGYQQKVIQFDPDLLPDLSPCLSCTQGKKIYDDFMKYLLEKEGPKAKKKPHKRTSQKIMPDKLLVAKVKKLRERLGLSQRKLSAKIGIDQADISRVESGRPIGPATLAKIEEGMERLLY